MRRLTLVVLLAACSHSRPSGPAWPAPQKPDADNIAASDGGESLAPHESNAIAAVIEKADAPEAKAAEVTPTRAAAPTEEKPAATPAVTPAVPDDVIMSDEIIIEIDD